MGRQKNWENKTVKKKLPETPVNTKKLWTRSGGWRRFWKKEGDRQRDSKGAAMRSFRQRGLGLSPNWLVENMFSVNSFGDLVARLKGTSVLAEMSSQDINGLFKTATGFRGIQMVLPYLCRQIAPLFASFYHIFQEECQELIKHYAANGADNASPGVVSTIFDQTLNVDQFAARINEISPDYQAAAESLRPFLRELADLYLANRLVRELKEFAKPREGQVDDYVEL